MNIERNWEKQINRQEECWMVLVVGKRRRSGVDICCAFDYCHIKSHIWLLNTFKMGLVLMCCNMNSTFFCLWYLSHVTDQWSHTHRRTSFFFQNLFERWFWPLFTHTHTQTILLRRLQYCCIAYVPLKSGTYRYPSLLREVFTPYSVSLCHIKYRCNPPYIQINNFSLFYPRMA